MESWCFVYTEYFIALRGGCEHLKIQQLFQVFYSLSSYFVLNDLFSWVLIETLAACRDCNYVKKRSQLGGEGEFCSQKEKSISSFCGSDILAIPRYRSEKKVAIGHALVTRDWKVEKAGG